MFIEKLDFDECKRMATGFLGDIAGRDRAIEWAKAGSCEKTASYFKLDFTQGIYFQQQAIMLTDFEVIATCAISPVARRLTNKYRQDMYRKFGKEYLDALDREYRAPIEREYQEQIQEHNDMIKFVTEGKEEM
jgi:hypothetical protein